MAEPILEHFGLLVAHHSGFLTPVPIPNSKGNPVSGGAKYTGSGKISQFSTEIDFSLGNGVR